MAFSVHTIWRAVLAVASLCLLASTALAASVTISSPGSNQTVSSPVHVVATASSSSTVKLMQIYLDGSKVKEVSGSKLDTQISASSGQHRLTVQAYDSSNYIFKSTIYFSVSGTSSSSTTSTTVSGTTTFGDIDHMSGWQSCDSCAGAGGQGPSTPYSMKQFISNPSMDGKSAEFFLGGTTPYAAALWWKQLGPRDSVTHFVYDLWFYMKDPAASQALEFDVNQTVNGKMYIFGTECNLRGSRTWRVWDYYKRWVDTGISCTAPKAYTWHHLVWEFERTSGGKTRFISVTLNGKKSYVNHYHNPKPKSVRELNVAFQMDGNSTMTDYQVWLDKIKLSVW